MKHLFKILSMAVLLMVSACQKSEVDSIAPIDFISDDALEQVGQVIEGHYIVTFRSDQLPAKMLKVNMTYDQKTALAKNEVLQLEERILGETTEIAHVYYSGIYGFAGELSDEMVARLQADPRVERIEPDRYFALAPGGGKGKPGGGSGDGGSGYEEQVMPNGISWINGGVAAPSGAKAWIIDTGIDFDHPDLNVNTSKSKSFIRNGTGDDENGHGTHVAGTVGAKDNDFGVIGVAAGVEVVAVQVLNKRGLGTLSDIVAGVQYVGANADAGDVANMSLGGDTSSTMDAAVEAAAQTCPFVLSAGNDRDDASNYSPGRTGLNNDDIFTISAFVPQGTYPLFPDVPNHLLGASNYGDACDYALPGAEVQSCYKNGGYETLSGTSMAAPHMAGLVLIGYTTHADSFAYYDDPDNLVIANLVPFHAK